MEQEDKVLNCIYCGAQMKDEDSLSPYDDGLHDMANNLRHRVCKQCKFITSINKSLKAIIDNPDNISKDLFAIENEIKTVRANKDDFIKYYKKAKQERPLIRENGY